MRIGIVIYRVFQVLTIGKTCFALRRQSMLRKKWDYRTNGLLPFGTCIFEGLACLKILFYEDAVQLPQSKKIRKRL